ncbi:protein ligase [Cocleimonas flava]|uniref:Biotin/lipoate A/B protein ligase family protein n=1 Tax=Cocleimonas flava TaxID=634765 RepID=A0A4R1ET33_9GAMM|nr:lipoate--protein ligase family protein [Cocleimonas flava]TCJ83082.1 biotin/lipoate A/B protein ligase family protein [Cocleimonas flava]
MIRHRNSLVVYNTIDEALADEQQLLEDIVAGTDESACFIWSANQCLVVPYKLTHNKYFEEAVKASESLGWPVYVRQTGGGITPQGPGILNISLGLANTTGRPFSIAESYGIICDPIIDELASQDIKGYCSSVPGAFCDGDYNVVVDGRKLVGTAQRRSRVKGQNGQQALFAHALLIYEANIKEITKAVNQLNSLLKLEQRVDSDAHCNFETLDLKVNQNSTAEKLTRNLIKRYRKIKNFS